MAKKKVEEVKEEFDWDSLEEELNEDNVEEENEEVENEDTDNIDEDEDIESDFPEEDDTGEDDTEKEDIESDFPEEDVDIKIDEEDDIIVDDEEVEEVKPKKEINKKVITEKGTNDIGELALIPISEIKVKRNTRKYFNEEKMSELIESIRQNGLNVPIIVRPLKSGYELVAGERRLRAYKVLNKTEIPAIIKTYDDINSIKTNFIENINREGITPIEEAQAIKEMIEMKIYENQKELANGIGKNQVYVSNKLKLLTLPNWLQQSITENKINEYHGSQIGRLPDENEMKKMFKTIQATNLSVRATEDKVNKVLEIAGIKKETKNKSHKDKAVYDYIDDTLPNNISVKMYKTGFVLSINHNVDDTDMTLVKALKYLSQNYKDLQIKIENERSGKF